MNKTLVYDMPKCVAYGTILWPYSKILARARFASDDVRT